MPNSLKSRLKGLVRQGLLSEKDLSRIYTDNDVIEELEKIETEIIRNSRPQWEKLVIDVATCQMLIRKEIEELKGENK